jgi:hypothetical protein
VSEPWDSLLTAVEQARSAMPDTLGGEDLGFGGIPKSTDIDNFLGRLGAHAPADNLPAPPDVPLQDMPALKPMPEPVETPEQVEEEADKPAEKWIIADENLPPADWKFGPDKWREAVQSVKAKLGIVGNG